MCVFPCHLSAGNEAPVPTPDEIFTSSPSRPAPSRSSQLTESIRLEHQLLRIPFEHYKKTIRANHQSLEREVSSVVSSVGDLADNDWSKDIAVSRLTSLVSRLQGLKRKLEEGSNVENLQAQRCRARIDHLDSADVENITEWNNTKLKRILVDYMLRMSYFDTASKRSESSNISVSSFRPNILFFIDSLCEYAFTNKLCIFS